MASKTMETAEKIMQQIAAHPADHTVRRNFAIAVGQAIHQGDVYLVRVEPTHPKGKLLGTRQIALGNSIGSRHIVRGDIEVYEGVDFPPVMLEDCKERERLGPRLVWRSGTLTHPEHANFTVSGKKGKGKEQCEEIHFQTLYQYDESTKRAVAD